MDKKWEEKVQEGGRLFRTKALKLSTKVPPDNPSTRMKYPTYFFFSIASSKMLDAIERFQSRTRIPLADFIFTILYHKKQLLI
jgi:hypothetical protein